MNYNMLFHLLKMQNKRPSDLVSDGIIAASTLCNLKANRDVSLFTLEKIADYLNCPAASLIGIERVPSPQQPAPYSGSRPFQDQTLS